MTKEFIASLPRNSDYATVGVLSLNMMSKELIVPEVK